MNESKNKERNKNLPGISNENEHTTQEDLRDTLEAVLREIFMATKHLEIRPRLIQLIEINKIQGRNS